MSGLRLDDVTVRFGGVTAVERVTVAAEAGRVTGLVGPNGAGKTTVLQVASGFVRPATGRVYLDGTDVTGFTPARRARAGLGRTFQRAQLFSSLSVMDNVTVAAEAKRWLAVRSPRCAAFDIAEAALRRCDALALADRAIGQLTTGQRRLVEVARSLASGCRHLLLDEPAAGLAAPERARLVELLRSLATDDGVAVLLVEHDLGLVASLCDQVVVLREGAVIFDGTAADWTHDQSVRTTYLGSDLARG